MGAKNKLRSKRTPSAKMVDIVLNATKELLNEGGERAITVRAIAAKADVAPMSVYNHFGDKQGLLNALVTRSFDQLAYQFAAMTELDPPKRLAKAGELYRKEMLSSVTLSQLMWSTPPKTPAEKALTELIRIISDGQAQGIFISGNAKDLAANIWVATHGAVYMEMWLKQFNEEPVVTFDCLIEQLIRGITK